MGASTTLLSLVNTLALRPIAVPDADSIVHIGLRAEGGLALFSYLDYLDYARGNQTFSGLVAFNKTAAALGDAPPGPDDGESPLMDRERVHAYGLIVTANYFDVLGARAKRGRTFSADEDRVPARTPSSC